MSFPTPFTVRHHAWSAGPVDAHNNVTDVFTPPLNQPGTSRPAIQLVPSTADPALAGHDRSVTDMDLFVPPGFTPGERDVIDTDLGRFQVVGFEDHCRGFHGWQPGNVIKLRKVAG